jgi:hypothetical protein
MIKWFCDVCGKEIKAPEHPDYVNAYYEGKNREHEITGWGDTRKIVSLCCHEVCAKKIGDAIVFAVACLLEPKTEAQ